MRGSGVDWEQVRVRLRASEAALEETLTASPARIEAAYHRRAVRLAGEPGRQRPVSASLPVLVFRLGEERYAIELKDLAETLPFAGCAAPPGARPQVLGVISVRGELQAVLDLGRLLTGSSGPPTDSGFVLMLRRRGREIGLKVEHIDELREIRLEDLTPPAQGNYVRGIAPGAVMLLDLEKVLASVFSKQES